MMEFQGYDVMLVPIVIGLVHVLRIAGVKSRYLPISAVLLGVVLGFVYLAPDDPRKAILSGVVVGLSAIGMWSGVRNTINSR